AFIAVRLTVRLGDGVIGSQQAFGALQSRFESESPSQSPPRRNSGSFRRPICDGCGMEHAIDRCGIERTYEMIAPHVRHTPVLDLDCVTLKVEQVQHAGSFKARGAMANLLLRDIPAAGVVAASGGNHGAAVAWAARTRGVPATIFVPTVCSPA